MVVLVVPEVKTSSKVAASGADGGKAAFEQICKLLGKQPQTPLLVLELNTSVPGQQDLRCVTVKNSRLSGERIALRDLAGPGLSLSDGCNGLCLVTVGSRWTVPWLLC